MQAWASWTNAHGGIDGHPVKLVLEDDAANATNALRAAKTLVEQDHVIAVLGVVDANQQVFGQYLQSKGVPVIGGSNSGPPWATSPDFFPASTTYTAAYTAYGQIAKAIGATNLGAIACSEAQNCAVANGLILDGAKADGLGSSFNRLVSSVATDYTPTCLAAKSAGVDALTFEEIDPVIVTTMTNCYNQGYKPKVILTSDGVTPLLLKQPSLYGTQIIGQTYPFFDAAGPGKDFHSAMAKYAASTAVTETTAEEWAAGLLFTAAAQAGHLGGNPTPADVIKGLYALPANETLGGFSPPVTFKQGQPHISSCYIRWEISSTGFTDPYGTAATCPSE